jgi:hypothetical protein
MADAIRAKDQAGWNTELATKSQKKQRSKTRSDVLATKTFEDLTPPQKDMLLKALAVKAGLILDSDG